jgi:site-specific recombinase XerD
MKGKKRKQFELTNKFMEWLNAEKKSPMTIRYYSRTINEFLEHCEKLKLPVDEHEASEFLIIKSEGKQGNSLRTYYFVLKTFFRFYTKKDFRDIRINFRPPRIKMKIPIFFSINQVLEILRNSEGRNIHNLFIRTIVATLARRNEVLSLTKNDLKIEKLQDDNNQLQEYHIISFRPEISKSEPRDIVVDKITWNKLNEIDKPKDALLFNFSLRNANHIVNKYRPIGTIGSCHAIRHGVARFIAGKMKYESDKEILKYYLGHKIMKGNVTNIYTTVPIQRMGDWYKNFSPLIIFAY